MICSHSIVCVGHLMLMCVQVRSSLSPDDYRTFKQSLLGLRTLIKRKIESSADEEEEFSGEGAKKPSDGDTRNELDQQLDAQFRVLIGLLEVNETLQSDLSQLVGKQFRRRYLSLLHSCRRCSKQEEDHFLRSQRIVFSTKRIHEALQSPHMPFAFPIPHSPFSIVNFNRRCRLSIPCGCRVSTI
jgi:hypothetical protein